MAGSETGTGLLVLLVTTVNVLLVGWVLYFLISRVSSWKTEPTVHCPRCKCQEQNSPAHWGRFRCCACGCDFAVNQSGRVVKSLTRSLLLYSAIVVFFFTSAMRRFLNDHDWQEGLIDIFGAVLIAFGIVIPALRRKKFPKTSPSAKISASGAKQA